MACRNQGGRLAWLHLSPGHALCIDGHLIHAERLVNGVSITQAESAARVDYYHVELEAHEVIFAENCLVESFRDEAFRPQFQNEAEFHALYPGQGQSQTPCLPGLQSGFLFQAIRARIGARAGIEPELQAPGPLRGYVDVAGPEKCSGWAQDLAAPGEPVCLDILCGGFRVARVMADLFRKDIQEAGLGGGYCGFEYGPSPELIGRIEVRRSRDGALLPHGAACMAA